MAADIVPIELSLTILIGPMKPSAYTCVPPHSSVDGPASSTRTCGPQYRGPTASVMTLMAAAALTPSLSRYAVVLVGVAAAFVLLTSTMIAAAVLSGDITASTGRPEVLDPLPALLADFTA